MKDTVGVKSIEMRLLGLHDQETTKGRMVRVVLQAYPGEIEALRGHVGKRFGVAMAQIGDDEKQVIIEGNSAGPPAAPDPAEKARRHLLKLAQMHRNDPPYQAVLIEYFSNCDGYEWINLDPYNKRDPVDRKNMVARIQHQFCGVTSLAEIKAHSKEATCLKLLEMLYEADKAGLPPPDMTMPNAFKQIADLYGG